MGPFLRSFAVAFAVVAAMIAGFNVVMDPFAFFGTPRIEGFNAKQYPKAHHFLYNVKPLRLAFQQPTTVILGTSRVLQGFDPSRLDSCAGSGIYNFGLSALSIDEIGDLFRYAAEEAPLREAFVELDFLSFVGIEGRRYKLPRRLNDARWKATALFDLLFSLRAAKYSLLALGINLTDIGRPHYLTPDGSRLWGPARMQPEQQLSASAYGLKLRPRRDPEAIGRGLEVLESMIRTARARGISLKFFIPPSHVGRLRSIMDRGEWEDFKDWKRRAVNLASKYGIPVWDFADYHPIAQEGATAGVSRYFQDLEHFTPEVGASMIARMCPESGQTAIVDGFGTRVDAANIERHLAKIDRQGRAFWGREQAVTAFYADLKQRALQSPRYRVGDRTK
jgi:hypothetical protein